MTNVVLEHSAMGRPCIGSNVPGVKEGIEDGKTGFLFAVRNVDSMVEAVEKFLHLRHEEKAAMGKNACEKMKLGFDRNIVTEIYVEEINRSIKR
jgi:galacturonosyltransferase